MKEKMELNRVYNEDCLGGLKRMEDNSVDCIYSDPPFFTQTEQKLKDAKGREYSFNDKWRDMEEYLYFLEIRFFEMKRVLKDTGSIFIHCDSTATHRIRIILERIFGVKNFQSEIIWYFRRWSNSKKGLLDSHQNILFFSKTKQFKFNTLYNEYSPTTNIDQILQDRVRDKNGKSRYKRDAKGEIVFTNNKKGVPLNDVWEIPYLNPKAKERVGYPTQKPIQLLEKIIEISTDEGDVVLDPFVGSGTAMVASKILNRKFIGFDINSSAVELCEARLKRPIKTESILLKKGISAFDNKTEYEKKILSRFNCDIVQRNKGLDAVLREKVNEKTVGIKIQKPDETMSEAETLLKKVMESKGLGHGIIIKTHSDLTEYSSGKYITVIEDPDYILGKIT